MGSTAERKALWIETLERTLSATLQGCSGALYRAALIEDQAYFTEIIALGDDARVRAMAPQLDGAPMWDETATALHAPPQWRRGGWSIRRPDPRHINRFSAMDEDADRATLKARPLWTRFYAPLGIDDQLRALCFDGPRFIGWLGVWRHGDGARFTRQEQDALNAQRAELVGLVRAIDEASRAPLEMGLLGKLSPQTHALTWQSASLAAWLTPARAARLQHALESSAPDAPLCVDGVALQRTALDAQTHLLATAAAAPLTLDVALTLTPTQLALLERMRAGARREQAAAELDIEPALARAALDDLKHMFLYQDDLQLLHLTR